MNRWNTVPSEVRVVLVGPMGSGKSAIARTLARQLEVAWWDTDSMVAVRSQQSVADVIREHGLPEFRRRERMAVSAALGLTPGTASRTARVVSLGGGAVVDADTRGELQRLPVVWLQIGVTAAFARMTVTGRPLLADADNPRQAWLQLAAEREPWYRCVATWQVPTDDQSPEELVTHIQGLLQLS